jgi:hypothetical protein
MTSLRVALKLSMAEVKPDEKPNKRKNPMLKEAKSDEPTLDDVISGKKRRASFESKDSKNKGQAKPRTHARATSPADESLTGRSESSGYYVGENGSLVSEEPRKLLGEDQESIISIKNDDASIVDDIAGDITTPQGEDIDDEAHGEPSVTEEAPLAATAEKERGQEAEVEAENDGDAEGDGSSSPKPSKKRKKRLPSILKSLEPISGVTEPVAETFADDLGAGAPRYQSSRAAAMVAKTKISAKGTGGRSNSVEDLSGATDAFPPPPVRRRKSSTANAGPQLNWVQCDKCSKWRSVAGHINNEELPEQWFCQMNTWDLHLNTCDAPEEEEPTSQPGASASGAAGRPRGSRVTLSVEDADGDAGDPNQSKAGTQRVWVKAGAGGRGRWQRTGDGPDAADDADIAFEDTAAEGNADEPAFGISSRRRSSGGSPRTVAGAVPLGRGISGSSTAGSNAALAQTGAEVAAVNWVQCNKCRKWRKVPESIDVDALPDRWYCSLNTWNPAVARCAAKQEVDELAAAAAAAAPAAVENRAGSRGRRGQGANATASSAFGVPGAIKQVSWVQCERRNCKKWRKVPAHIDTALFPEKWYCEMNTWDPDSATCDAPEPSDSENEQPGGAASRQQLILGNSKSANALSYRRIIFGTDGRIRVCFSDKNKTGYGIFSYAEAHKPSNDADDYTAPTRRVAYWWSGAYDESAGVAAAQAAQSAGGRGGKKAAATTALAVELSPADKTPGADEASDAPAPTYLLDMARRMYGMPSKPPAFSWPKKVCKSWTVLQGLSLFRRQSLECTVVMSCFMAAGTSQVLLSKLLSLAASCRFTDEEVEACRAYMNLDVLKAAVKRLEDKGLVEVSYASAGQLSVEVLPSVTQLTQACNTRGAQAVSAVTAVSPAWTTQGLPLKLRKFTADSKYKSSSTSSGTSAPSATTASPTLSADDMRTEQAAKPVVAANAASAVALSVAGAAPVKPFRLQHRDKWAASVGTM